jgi:acyl carrier protein
VVAEAHLQDDLEGDSLAVMRLAETIGTHYGIEIIAEDLLDIDNVGELVDLVESKIS